MGEETKKWCLWHAYLGDMIIEGRINYLLFFVATHLLVLPLAESYPCWVVYGSLPAFSVSFQVISWLARSGDSCSTYPAVTASMSDSLRLFGVSPMKSSNWSMLLLVRNSILVGGYRQFVPLGGFVNVLAWRAPRPWLFVIPSPLVTSCFCVIICLTCVLFLHHYFMLYFIFLFH